MKSEYQQNVLKFKKTSPFSQNLFIESRFLNGSVAHLATISVSKRCHTQCPLARFEKKNVSKVCRIFLESISYDNSKMVCLKIRALGISELTLLNGPKKH